MHLSKLKIYGFKSFAQKVEVVFPQRGIVSVVGPNGCGKSNLVDAIRWVIGEQRGSQMRSKTGLAGLIFNGTEDKPPLNMAEVSLLLDNSDGTLPSQYSEVQLTRRLIRRGSGEDQRIESYYFLNNQECTLRDLRNLLKDTGMGATSYSIMTQEMMNVLILGNPDERRRLFEEAAGIAKYKQQRKETANKFAQIVADLDHVRELLDERQRRFRSAEARMEKARKAREVRARARELYLALNADRWRRMGAELGKIKAEADRLEALKADLTLKRDAEQARAEELKLLGSEDEREYSERRAEVEEAASRVRELEGEAQVLALKIENHGSARARIENDIADAGRKIGEYRSKIGSQDDRLEELARKIGEAESALDAADERRQALDSRLDEAREGERALFEKGGEIDRRLAEAESRAEMIRSRIQSEAGSEAERLGDVRTARGERDALEASIAELEGAVEAAGAEISALEEDMRLAREAERAAQEEIDAVRPERDEVRDALSRRSAELEVLERQEKGGEGVRRGAKRLREAKADRISGLLLDVLETRAEDAEIVEAALGEAAQTVLAGSPEEARALAEFLESENAGRAWIAGGGAFPRTEAPGLGEGTLAERTGCDGRWRPLVDWLLGRFVRARDAGEAWRLALENGGRDLWFCAPGPLLVHSSGLVRGGSGAEDGAGILSRRARLAELGAERAELEERASGIEARLGEAEARLAEARGRASGDETVLARKREELAGKRNDLVAAQGRRQNADDRIAILEQTIARSKDAVEPLREELSRAEEAARAVRAESEAARGDRECARTLCAEIESELRSANDDWNQANNALTGARGDLQHYNENIGFYEGQIVEETERQERLRGQLEQIDSDNDSALGRKESLSGEIQTAYAALDERKERFSVAEEKYSARRDERNEALAAALKWEQQINSFSDTSTDLARKYSQIDTRLSTISEETFNLYEVDLSRDDLSAWPAPEDPEAAEAELKRLQAQERELGSSSVDLDEFEKEKESFLETQRQFNDLDGARVRLERTMERLDRIARENFRRTFEQIRGNFQSVFSGLMAGGETRLTLDVSNGADELDAPIEIKARPTGKAMCEVEKLSNGERGLTALSLLFAIYLVKPAPFCVLDECDAPFDDANRQKFVQLLRRFTNRTQFVVITHQKTTMAASDRLYGVTQEVAGISQVVSVQLEEAASLADPSALRG